MIHYWEFWSPSSIWVGSRYAIVCVSVSTTPRQVVINKEDIPGRSVHLYKVMRKDFSTLIMTGFERFFILKDFVWISPGIKRPSDASSSGKEVRFGNVETFEYLKEEERKNTVIKKIEGFVKTFDEISWKIKNDENLKPLIKNQPF